MKQALKLLAKGPDTIEVPDVSGTKVIRQQVGQSDIDREMGVRRSLARLDDDTPTPTKTETPTPKPETASKPIGTQIDDVDTPIHGASDDAHIRALNENTQAVRDQTEALRVSAMDDGDADGDGDTGDGDDKAEAPKKKTR